MKKIVANDGTGPSRGDLSLLESILTEGKLVHDQSQREYARDLVGEFVNEVLAGTVASKSIADVIDDHISEIDAIVAEQLDAIVKHKEFRKLHDAWQALRNSVSETGMTAVLQFRLAGEAEEKDMSGPHQVFVPKKTGAQEDSSDRRDILLATISANLDALVGLTRTTEEQSALRTRVSAVFEEAIAKEQRPDRVSTLTAASGGLLTTSQVAKLLGVTPQAVRLMRQEGRVLGVASGSGSHWKFPAAQFEESATLSSLHALLRQLDGYRPWDALELLLSLDVADPAQRPLGLLRAGDRHRAVHTLLATRARRRDLVRQVSQGEANILALLDDDLEVLTSEALTPGPTAPSPTGPGG